MNDIKKPVRITVSSRDEMLKVIRGAHHIKDAIEIYFDGLECIYYICEWTEQNAKARWRALRKASGLLQRRTPANFNIDLIECHHNYEIPPEIFREVVI